MSLESTSETIEQFAAYNKAFFYFNEKLFSGKLKPVMLNFSRKSPRVLGFFAPQRWMKDGNADLAEISLNPQHLNRNIEDVFATLVHEMVHLWQSQYGKTSRNGYHNKEWADKMLDIGLVPLGPGGKQTGQSMSHEIADNGVYIKAFREIPSDHILPWKSFMDGSGKTKKSSSRVKYSCPSCETSVWGKNGISILCNNCEVTYKPNL